MSSTITQTSAVDQQARQIENIQSLRPINGPQVTGSDGSQTPPQVSTMVNPMDGELPRPSTVGNDFYRKAREIRRDPTIKLVRELTMAPLLMAEWEYEASQLAPMGAKELVEEIMAEARLPLLRTTLCGLTDFGWQPYEIIGDQCPDGTTRPRFKPLLQDLTSILVDAADGSFFGLRQTPMIGLRLGWIYLLDEDCVVVSQDVEGTNWYGEPTLRALEATYDESQVVNKSARKYDAKIAGTHWVIYYPLGTSNMNGEELDNGEIAKRLLQQAEAVGGICVPRSVVNTLDSLNAAAAQSEASQWKIELLTDSGKGQQPFTDRQKYLDVLKVRAFGWPERAILEGQFGTKAEAGEHADVAVSNLEVRHALICAQYNQKIVNWILTKNYGPDARGCVKIKPSPLADDTRAFLEKLYLAMVANPQGFMTEVSSLDMSQLRERLGLPEHHMGQVDPTQMPPPDVDPMTGMLLPAPIAYSWSDTEAAHEADADASDAQRKAGNYRKGKLRLHGMSISIETPRGERRKPEWPKLPAHYGYIRRTEGEDGDHLDVFVGKHAADASRPVHVIHQNKRDGSFDEHKVMLGFKNRKKAVKAYSDAYGGRDPARVRSMSIDEFKQWMQRQGIASGV